MKLTNDIIKETHDLSINKTTKTILNVGYLKGYTSNEFLSVIAKFNETYPEIEINVIKGNHEELYHMLRNGEVSIVINDQRRTFSDNYVNYELKRTPCYIEIASSNLLATKEEVNIDDLKDIPCILFASKGQENIEKNYYQELLNINDKFLFTDSIEQAELLVTTHRGFLLIEGLGTLPTPKKGISRLKVVSSDNLITQNYCAFWKKANNNFYLVELAKAFKKGLGK